MKRIDCLSIDSGQASGRWVYGLCALLLSLMSTTPLVAETEAIDIEIGIVTYGPGTDMMSRFGHTAIVLFDANDNKVFYELAAGYTETESFKIPWYLTPGPLVYIAQEKNRNSALHQAFEKKRSVSIRVLNLNTRQKQHFASLLADAIDEQNALFEFGLFSKNCTTRVRDILDKVLAGQLIAQFNQSPALMSYRQHIHSSFAYQPTLFLATDLLTGRSVDHQQTLWQEAALPEIFANLLDQAQVTADNGTLQALVKSHQPLFDEAIAEPVVAKPIKLIHWFLLSGLLLAGGLLFYGFTNHHLSIHWPLRIWLIINGSIGVFIAYLWLIGGEPLTAWNENILLFNPLCLWLGVRQQPRWKKFVGIGLLLSILLAIALKGFTNTQNNWGWIALTIPTHSIVLYQLFAIKNKAHIKCPYCRPKHRFIQLFN